MIANLTDRTGKSYTLTDLAEIDDELRRRLHEAVHKSLEDFCGPSDAAAD